MKKLTTVNIKATKGKEMIHGSKLFFWIDSGFENYGLNVPSEVKAPIRLDVFELDKNLAFKDIFTQPEKMVLTQSQILEFVKTHKEHLRTGGYSTFFLTKVGDNFFVVLVYLDSGGKLKVFVDHFSGDDVWRGQGLRRVVVPQLTLSESSSESSDTLTSLTLESAIKICKEAGYKIYKEL